jgi:putative ABC transport system permease protein
MNVASLALLNLRRNRVRFFLTVLGVGIAVLTFNLLRAVVESWLAATQAAAVDRLVTRHKVTFTMTLPKRYIDEVRRISGVTHATFANWYGAKLPQDEGTFFATLAVDSESFFQVYDEMVVPPEQLAAWQKDRRGVIVGDALAKKFNWKVGDRLVLVGSFIPGEWEFFVRGIYHATRKSVDRFTLLLHWRYLNEQAPVAFREQIGWIVSRIDQPERTATLGRQIDRHFDSREIQTLSQSERAFNLSFLGMFSAIITVSQLTPEQTVVGWLPLYHDMG